MQDVDYQGMYTRLGQAMVDSAPEGWNSLELTSCVVGDFLQQGHFTIAADGERTRCSTPDYSAYLTLLELRKALYEQDKGAWWTAVAIVSAEGRFTLNLDYDNEPTWDFDISDEMYAADIQRFPRTPENTPAWLAERLRRSGSLDDQQ